MAVRRLILRVDRRGERLDRRQVQATQLFSFASLRRDAFEVNLVRRERDKNDRHAQNCIEPTEL